MKKYLLLVVLCFTAVIGHTNPPPAAEVFQVGVSKVDPNTFSINFQVKPEYFLYSDRIKLEPQSDEIIHLGTVRFPAALNKTDKQGQTFTVYRNQIDIPVGILGNKPGTALLNLHYQGCSDDGFCYAPEDKVIQVTIDEHLALSAVSLKPSTSTAEPTGSSQNSSIAKIFLNNNWAMILFTFFGFGLLLSFTPCILPMVPVLSGIIIGHGKEITTGKAFLLSLSYVLSMSVTYAIIGAVVALLGANLQISMQSPWSIGLFSLVFVLLALSMFGFYEFKLPNSWQAKIGNTSRTQRGGHYLGAAIMGCLSTLILSPCVTAPLIGVLTYIAQTGNVLLGCLTLFFLSLGMGTPLLLIGTSAGKWLPETGGWMNTIKAMFGIIFIGVAIHLISRIAPPILSMGLWASLLIFSGIYSGALTYSYTGREKLSQGIGLILLVYGFLILVGASMGSTNPLQPLSLALVQASNAPTVAMPAHTEQTVANIEHAIKKAHGKPVMLDFYANWCNSCKIMEATTFQDPRVKKALSHFAVIKIDVTTNNTNNKDLLHHFDVVAPPTFIFFDAQGKPLPDLKSVGESSADEFLEFLDQIK